MFKDTFGNFLLPIGIIAIVLVVMLIAQIIAGEICLVHDWQCKINHYEARIEACMDTERLTLDECRWVAVND